MITYDNLSGFLRTIISELPDDPDLNLIENHVIDSFTIIEMVTGLEERYDIAFTADTMTVDRLSTVNRILATVNEIKHGER